MSKSKRKNGKPDRKDIKAAAKKDLKTIDLTASAAIKVVETAEGETPKRPTFQIEAYGGGQLRLGGFYRPIVIDLTALRGDRVTILRDHDQSRIIGQGTARIGKAKVTIAGQITGEYDQPGEPAYDVVSHAKNGFVWGASVGVSVDRMEYIDAGQKVRVNNRTFTGPIGVVRAGRLGEVSFVGVGADETAIANIAAKAAGTAKRENDMDFEQWLSAGGWDIDALSEAQTDQLRATFDAEQADEPPKKKSKPKEKAPQVPPIQASGSPSASGRDVDAVIAAAKAERERCRQVSAIIEEAASTAGADLEALDALATQATDEKWAVKDLELRVLRLTRPKAPTGRTRQPEMSRSVLEAALCLQYRIGDEKMLLAGYGEQALNQADKYRRIGVRKMGEICAAMAGVDLPISVDQEWIHAAFSTTDLTGILGAVANKALASSFEAARAVAPNITRAVSHKNFHSHTVYSMALTGDLEPVAPSGELKHMQFGEESWTRQVATRGAVLRISRKDLINDELGTFTDNARNMGRKAVVSREKVLFLAVNETGAGSTFCTAANGNYFDGAATNLQHSSLSTAVQMFRDQTGPDGDPVMIEPKILLVPTALEEVAKALMHPDRMLIATALGSTSAAKRQPQINIWSGNFSPEVSEWLSRTIGSQAGSSTAWYLMADPADVAALEIAYLDGKETPTVEYFGLDQDVNVLGVSWRVFWDFGVARAEYRAMVKSKGSA